MPKSRGEVELVNEKEVTPSYLVSLFLCRYYNPSELHVYIGCIIIISMIYMCITREYVICFDKVRNNTPFIQKHISFVTKTTEELTNRPCNKTKKSYLYMQSLSYKIYLSELKKLI